MNMVKIGPHWQSATVVSVAIGALLMFGTCLADESVAVASFDDLGVIEADNLDELRGRDGDTSITVSSNQTLQAIVTGSEFNAGTINSGSVSFGENAIGNFSGIGLFNIVTGNNNAVDTALGVSFNLQ